MTSIRELAADFLRDHESKKLVAGQHDWHYYRGGDGDPVLLLTGGAGIGIAWLDLAPALSPRFRTLAVDFPPLIETCDEVIDGLVAVLDTEGVEQTHVVGQSAGGMFAELLSRRAPERIRSLTLTSTGLYGPEDVDRLRMRVDTAGNTPWTQARESVRTALRSIWGDTEDAEFWIEQIEAVTDPAGSAGAVLSYQRMLQLAERVDEIMAGPSWQGPTLILRADDDPLITTTHTERLLTLHPDCEYRTIPTGGHSLLISRPTEYISAVTEFLSAT
ncbi:alpha/beta fold hydrolase [Nocardia sp. GCM10030253]|uniref:alpha/beta fold hydrolase n=1 Tax=Nocardia sp. GCM10030253 TaxID=3273404 RepID=UPI003635D349